MLTKSAKNTFYIFSRGLDNGFQIFTVNICCTETKDTGNHFFGWLCVMNSHQIFTDLEHTLERSEFLGKTAVGIRLFIVDEHNIHRAISDIAEHIYT